MTGQTRVSELFAMATEKAHMELKRINSNRAEGDPGGDPGHAGVTLSIICFGNAFGSSWKPQGLN